MAPNPGPELVKRARERATRLADTKAANFMKISTLLSNLRREPLSPCYESVSGNVNRILRNSVSVSLPNVFSFTELNKLTSKDADSEGTAPEALKNETVTVFGWCKSIRKQDGGRLLFVIVNDGSSKSNLQIVVHSDSKGFDQAVKAHSGASIKAQGFLLNRFLDSEGKDTSLDSGKGEYELLEAVGNKFELHVTSVATNYIQVVGVNMFPNKYPISKKSLTLEYLREVAHLRPRSYLISATMRVRNALAVAVHLFFQSLGCNYLNSPVITTADCEGAGELFQVTTLFEHVYKLSDLSNKMTAKDITASKEGGELEGKLENLKLGEPNNPDNNEGKGNHEMPTKKPEFVKNVNVNYKNDFFKKKSYLTCSGQLSAENYCCSMGSVYTFGPTFRAENSHTSRHLAEFWMIEPELVLVDLPALMGVTEKFIKFLVSYVLEHCYDDLHYFNQNTDNNLLERLRNVVDKEFVHVSYTDVIDILKEYVDNSQGDSKFEYNDIYWGMDLQSEHERFISEEVFDGPVIIYNYPKTIKAFYMRRNDDKKTVAAMDLIIPKIGELIGGSQREERLDYLLESIKENKLNEDDYWWYLDLRRYGTVVHSGFGLGFERLIMMVTGVNNIRDVIPFPRYPGHSAF